MLEKEQKLFSLITFQIFHKLQGLKKLDISTICTTARRVYLYLLHIAGTCN